MILKVLKMSGSYTFSYGNRLINRLSCVSQGLRRLHRLINQCIGKGNTRPELKIGGQFLILVFLGPLFDTLFQSFEYGHGIKEGLSTFFPFPRQIP